MIDNYCVHPLRDSRELNSETSAMFYHFAYGGEVFLRSLCYIIAVYG